MILLAIDLSERLLVEWSECVCLMLSDQVEACSVLARKHLASIFVRSTLCSAAYLRVWSTTLRWTMFRRLVRYKTIFFQIISEGGIIFNWLKSSLSEHLPPSASRWKKHSANMRRAEYTECVCVCFAASKLNTITLARNTVEMSVDTVEFEFVVYHATHYKKTIKQTNSQIGKNKIHVRLVY